MSRRRSPDRAASRGRTRASPAGRGRQEQPGWPPILAACVHREGPRGRVLMPGKCTRPVTLADLVREVRCLLNVAFGRQVPSQRRSSAGPGGPGACLGPGSAQMGASAAGSWSSEATFGRHVARRRDVRAPPDEPWWSGHDGTPRHEISAAGCPWSSGVMRDKTPRPTSILDLVSMEGLTGELRPIRLVEPRRVPRRVRGMVRDSRAVPRSSPSRSRRRRCPGHRSRTWS